MSLPKAIFIDTSIFDEQSYNFSSSTISSFLEAAKTKGLILLMPDATEREVRRHIKARAESALKALEDAKRKAPFLAKWKDWPLKRGDPFIMWELERIAQGEMNKFLGCFEVKRLGYKGINLPEVMDWYDAGRAPFGSGKKRKEFPDALALAALLAFAATENCQVAVVSKDRDHQLACTHYTQLLYFPSLPALSESLLAEEPRLAVLKSLMDRENRILLDAIGEAFQELSFYPLEDPSGDVDDVSVDDVEFTDLRIVAVGEHQCTVAFVARVDYSAYVSYDDPEAVVYDPIDNSYDVIQKKEGTVSDWNEISGAAKLTLNETWDDIVDYLLQIDDTDICITEAPYG